MNIRWIVATVLLALAGCGSAEDISATSEGDTSGGDGPDRLTDSQASGPRKAWVVSPTGNDAAAGTESAPWRTIQRCANEAKAGDRCRLRAGVYRETVIPARSGTSDAPIRFEAYPDEKVTVNGADPITGWTPTGNRIYSAPLPSSLGHETQVFANGERLWEARWPNINSFSLSEMRERRGTAAEAAPTSLQDPNLPSVNWTGATLHVQGGTGAWLSQTTVVTAFDAAARRLTFPRFTAQGVELEPTSGNRYYLSGTRAALDAPGEWFIDPAQQLIHLVVAGADAPTSVEVSRRLIAFDLRERAFVEIRNIHLFAASVAMKNSSHCILDGLVAKHIYSSSKASDGYASQANQAIQIIGNQNELRNSEIGFSSGSGVFVNGNENKIINNHIHDINYIGAYAAGIYLADGSKNLVSHNTIAGLGRSAIQQNASASVIQYNDMHNGMILSNDGGMVYSWGIEFGGARIHHNWVHDVSAVGGVGIYLDNFLRNAIVDHNVIFNINENGITVKSPQSFAFVYNNTVFNIAKTGLAHWGEAPYEREWFGSRLVNNLFPDTPVYLSDAKQSTNVPMAPRATFVDVSKSDYRLAAGSAAVDRGTVIPGITDGYTGSAPDIGAYEAGEPAWRAGHDFAMNPQPVYATTTTPFLNRIVNGGFEMGLTGWTREGGGEASLAAGADGATGALKRGGHKKLKLSGQRGGVVQTVTGLRPKTAYVATAWLHADAGEALSLALKNTGTGDFYVNASAAAYDTRKEVRFVTGPASTSVEIHLWKDTSGSGAAYGDDLSLVEVD